MAENTNTQNNNGTNNPQDNNPGKKTLKQKINDALDKEHKFKLKDVFKGVAFAAAIPIAFVIGKNMQKNQDQELLDLATSDPESPAALPDNQDTEVTNNVVDVEYEEVTTD